MSYFDRRPEHFRLLFGILALVLLIITSINAYRYGKAPTDENWFKDPNANLYITHEMRATPEDETAGAVNAVLVGDLLFEINGVRARRAAEVDSIIRKAHPSSPLTLTVLRTTENRFHSYHVSPASIPPEFVRELPHVAYVFDVIEAGASDRAGMKPGDLITRINGQTFTTVTEADLILRQAQIGKTIDYEVIRDNALRTLHVTVASFGLPIAMLAILLTGLVYMGTGSFLALKRPHLKAAQLTGLFFLTLGFFLSVSVLQRDITRDWFALVRDWVMGLALYFGLVLHVHAGHYFPRERPELLSRRWILILGYSLVVPAVPLVIIFGDSAFSIGIAVLVLYNIIIPILFRKQASPEYRKPYRIIRWTIIGVSLCMFGTFFIMRRMDLGLQRLDYIAAFLLLIPLAYLYTIGRYHLLDLNIRVRKNIQYSIASIGWMVAAAAALLWILVSLPQADLGLPNIRITGASIELLDESMSPTRQVTAEKGVLMVLAIALTFVFWKGARAGQEFLATKFYRSRFDYRRAAAELAEVMATRLTMADLAKGIVAKLAELMRLKRVGVLFFRDQRVCCCMEAYGFDGSSWKEFCMSTEAEVAQAIQGFHNDFSVDYLPANIKAAFRAEGFLHVIPVRSKEKLVGALLIGEKLSEASLQNEDLEFIGSVAKQASVAVENAFLYEELAVQERLKHELAIARRIQLESLPQATPDVAGLQVAGISIPAQEVGGDYYDYLNGDPRRLTVIIGDVSGKGTSAALYMSKVQGILRSLHDFGLSPRELFIRANHLLCRDLEKRSFVTAMGGTFSPEHRRLVFSRAGHVPLFHYSTQTHQTCRVVPRGLGLGLSAEHLFADELQETTITYDPGDLFVFVTDGITEGQRENGEEFGEERLMNLLTAHAAETAAQIKEEVIAAVGEFAGPAHQHDDQTVVVVKVES